MPIQIGAKLHNFADPTGLLSDCHRRVEMFLRALESVGRSIDQPATEEIRQSLAGALRYFAQAAPKHTADEEESLFPRLHEVDDPEVRATLDRLDKLESDHRWAAPLHLEVERLGTQYLVTGRLSNAEVTEFRRSVTSLREMYQQHIRIEDELIFPLAVRVLSEKQKATIAQEMAARRNVTSLAQIS